MYCTSAVNFCRCMVVLLRSFISALFLYFFLGPSLLEMKFYWNFSLVLLYLFCVFVSVYVFVRLCHQNLETDVIVSLFFIDLKSYFWEVKDNASWVDRMCSFGEKPLEVFSLKPCLSCNNSAILKKLVVFLEEATSSSGHITSLQGKV